MRKRKGEEAEEPARHSSIIPGIEEWLAIPPLWERSHNQS